MSGGRTIVVGIDDSAEARSALAWARAVAASDDHIVAVHAWTNVIAEVPAYTAIAVFPDEDAQRIAKEDLERMVEDIDDPRLRSLLVRGRPGPSIVTQAADADLIVVGHRGSGRVAMMLGSTANHVARHALCPVVITRGDAVAPPDRVVVGADAHHLDPGSNESVAALRWAYRLGGVEEIRVLHAWTTYPQGWDITSTSAAPVGDPEAAARRVVDQVISGAGLVPPDVRVVSEVVGGEPAAALLAAGDDADLIVVGTRGRGGFRGLLLGSTSSEVAAHARVPVAIVR
jgi:nucleotide-binding universal stress UspA family protein